MKHIIRQTYRKPVHAITVDVILTIIVQVLSAVRTLLETKKSGSSEE